MTLKDFFVEWSCTYEERLELAAYLMALRLLTIVEAIDK